MRQYESKVALIQEIRERYQKFRQEFDEIPEALRNQRIAGCRQDPFRKLVLPNRLGQFVIVMEAQEQQGMSVHTPAGTNGTTWRIVSIFLSDIRLSLTLAQQQELLDQK